MAPNPNRQLKRLPRLLDDLRTATWMHYQRALEDGDAQLATGCKDIAVQTVHLKRMLDEPGILDRLAAAVEA